jgi:hypothetical protein
MTLRQMRGGANLAGGQTGWKLLDNVVFGGVNIRNIYC